MLLTKKVYLGGTCNNSKWRDELIPLLNCQYFNPIVDDWNEEAQKRELMEREFCRFLLYTITPEMTGVYSIAEVVDDSNKRPERTILCILQSYNDKRFTESQWKSLLSVAKMIERNGGKVFTSLTDVANYINDNSK